MARWFTAGAAAGTSSKAMPKILPRKCFAPWPEEWTVSAVRGLGGTFRGWLWTIAKNKASTHFSSVRGVRRRLAARTSRLGLPPLSFVLVSPENFASHPTLAVARPVLKSGGKPPHSKTPLIRPVA